MISPALIKQNLGNVLVESNFPEFGSKHRGKVRDSYSKDGKRTIIVSDRISAFDVVLKQAIPFKGQVLNQIAAYFMQATADIIPNHIIAIPDPNVTIAKECKPYAIEVIVRGYLAGSAWRAYESGKRKICGVALPEGLKMNQKLETPIVTPTTKAEEGHDMDITREEIIDQGIVPALVYEKIEQKAIALFERGTKMANERGLLLVDTKYEFADNNGELTLIDEANTPDSSRYFYKEGYKENFEKEYKQHQLSKEFVREWLKEQNFTGEDYQTIPDMDEDTIVEITSRYVELYEMLTGQEFKVALEKPINERIKDNLNQYFL